MTEARLQSDAPPPRNKGRRPKSDTMRRREFISMMVLLGSAMSTAGWGEERTYRVAFLALEPADEPAYLLRRLRELGYYFGRNLVFVQRSARGDPSRLAELAQELVGEEPDVIVTGFGTLAARAAQAATTSIPIVFTTVGDPIAAGIID